MNAVIVNYCHHPKDWWLTYGIQPQDTIVYDRSDDGIERTFAAKTYETENKGDVDFDKLSYLVENYHTLPDVFFWGKSNIFKYVDEPTLKKAVEKGEFAPLLTQDHRIYSDRFGAVNMYKGGMYCERNDSWYCNAGLDSSTRYRNWSDWSADFLLPNEAFIPFPPGGSFLLTRERVHRYGVDFYRKMRDTLPYAQHPVTAHFCERSYFYLWK